MDYSDIVRHVCEVILAVLVVLKNHEKPPSK